MYLKLELSGKMAHFKKRAYSNNPLTYTIMHKPAFIGLFAAVCGINRKEMNILYPILCEDIKYSFKFLKWPITQAYAFSCREALKLTRTRKYFQYIINPHFEIVFELISDRSQSYFEKFRQFIKKDKSIYKPYFGTADCFAKIKFIEEGYANHQEGIYTTYSITPYSEITEFPENQMFITESLPTFESNFKHLKFKTFTYSNKEMNVKGPYIQINNEYLCQI